MQHYEAGNIKGVHNKKIARLVQKIQHIEGFKPIKRDFRVSLGLECIDASYPHRSFPIGTLHQFEMPTQNPAPAVSFMSIIAAKISTSDRPIIWITKGRNVYPASLANFGIQPDKIIFVHARRDIEVLWAMEEALRCRRFAVAIAEVADIAFTLSCRLQLAARQSGVTGFVMRSNAKKVERSACISSWRVTALPSVKPLGMPGVGHPRWKVELLKIKNGKPGHWDVEWRGGGLYEVKQVEATRVNLRTAAN